MIPFHLALVVVLAAGVSACSSAAGGTSTLTVLAASSLSGVLPPLARQFEAEHPGTRVVLSFGASSTLVQQVRAGAPADVLATASSMTMQQVVTSGDADRPRTFAANVGEIAVYPPSAPRVRELRDLAAPGLRVALCQPQVPCGVLASRVLSQAGLTVTPVTQGLDVKSTLAAVTSGEADAALVYVTDVRAAGAKVVGVPIPDTQNASTSYDAATVHLSKHAELGTQLIDLLLSADGQRVLSAAGFRAP